MKHFPFCGNVSCCSQCAMVHHPAEESICILTTLGSDIRHSMKMMCTLSKQKLQIMHLTRVENSDTKRCHFFGTPGMSK